MNVLAQRKTAISMYAIPGVIEIPSERETKIVSFIKAKKQHKSRKRELVIPRQIAMALDYVFTEKSLADVGAQFGKDHATVIHAIRGMMKAVDVNDPLVMPELLPEFRHRYELHINNFRTWKDLNKETRVLTDIVSEKLIRIKFAIALVRRIKR